MRSLVLGAAALLAGPALACGSCRPVVMARIAEMPLAPTLLALWAPLLVLALTALLVARLRRRP